ncbi:WecB/TagA/CpsF family glycosyltransferase [Mucilaginibacter sp. FT3.2]|uniref:WecB/TagA/CpsF family glycosyltransferase n=1 Tax=Mucilaginibacter sp. FT3.2 TaxID=2723090 RepID=UPI00160ED324|nr:WecB/TagA/CpsF family glycosyltransferase [Mucilaginibacter sp. FT3.2]MBB6234179.1 N-acetylglucosaminyldiphosphoundecaprenol N-acetyl-beta-D-mannosaminyltransferase [Mucilaginibacter sp. FT3.2]
MDIYNILTSKIPASIEEFDPRKKKLITFLNPHSYTLAFKNTELFKGFDVIAPDGILVVFILNLVKAATFKIKRFSCDMTSIVPYIFNIAIESKLSVYLLGSDADSVGQSTKVFKNNFPALNITGFRSGYFNSDAERIATIHSLVAKQPDMILIGMGAILQEAMAVDLREAGYTGAIYTCGGFLHQTKKEINFYPQFINKINLRFFYRIYKENGFLKRSIKTYPTFCFLIFCKVLRLEKKRQ